MPRELVDDHDPRRALEEKEDAPAESDRSAMFRDVFAWLGDTNKLVGISFNYFVACYVICPDLLNGRTLEDIAREFGMGRSAVHNKVREFEDTFHVRSRTARSEEARRNYADSYRARNGSAPHSYNPKENGK